MSIPDGFKVSEVGVIPVDWEVRKLLTLISIPIQNGVFNDPKRKGRGYKLINVGDLYSTIPIDSKKLELFDASKDEITRFSVANGDIFFTRSSLAPDGIAHCNIYKKEDDEEIVFDCHIIRVRGNTDKIEPFFLFRYCLGSLARRYLISHAKTTTMTTIDQGVIANLPILVPPLAEQKAIAQSLSDVDNLITAIDKLITKKRNIKQGTMQELLTGKKRLPGFTGEWEVKYLRDCLIKNPDYGINAAAVPYSDMLPTYIRITDISEDGNFLAENKVSVIHQNAHNYFLEIGDIVLARTGASTGKSYLYNVKDGKLVFAGFLIRVRPDTQKLYPRYLKGYLETQSYWNWVKVMSMRSGQPGINGNEYSHLKIPLPSLPEQKAIAKILTEMDEEIEALEKKREKYKNIKQGMMQELLTGKTRLKINLEDR